MKHCHTPTEYFSITDKNHLELCGEMDRFTAILLVFRALIGVLVFFEIIERAHGIFGYLFVSGQKYFSITSYRMAGQHGNKDACRVQSENVTCKHFMNES